MSLKLWTVVVAVLLCAARRASADRVIDVDAGDARDAPFEPGELAAALRLRVASDGRPLRVHLVAIAGGVRVETAEGERDVALGDLHGPAAARLVALTASDLLLDDSVALPELPARSVRSLTVLGSAANWDGGLAGASVELAIARGAWLAAVEVGAGGSLGSFPVYAAVVRLTAGVRVGWLELRAGATVMPIDVTAGVGDVTALVGGGASARVRIPVVDGVDGVVAGGVDAFATRTHYALDGTEGLTTPWVAPWLALGVEVDL